MSTGLAMERSGTMKTQTTILAVGVSPRNSCILSGTEEWVLKGTRIPKFGAMVIIWEANSRNSAGIEGDDAIPYVLLDGPPGEITVECYTYTDVGATCLRAGVEKDARGMLGIIDGNGIIIRVGIELRKR